MIGFVKHANLPQGNVRSIICGELCDELNAYFDSIGIERLTIGPNVHIDPAVKYHADMAVLHMSNGEIIIDRNQQELGRVLKEKGFSVFYTTEPIKGEYPEDIALNFAVVGDKLFGKFAFADKTVLSLGERLEKINVKQGYCKCSCLIVDDNAFITDDSSIYNEAVKFGLDCLLISKGDVALPGHEYGFIGGASGKISKSEILFFGDITKHRDYKKISDFIEKHGCKIISSDFPLTDFGGIIPVFEEKV